MGKYINASYSYNNNREKKLIEFVKTIVKIIDHVASLRNIISSSRCISN